MLFRSFIFSHWATKVRGGAIRSRCLSTATNNSKPLDAAARSKLLKGYGLRKSKTRRSSKSSNPLLVAGLPLVLFSVLGSWVVSNAVGGKLKERETAQGVASKSVRQAALEQEHDEMMEKLNKIVENDDFDNTKRIKRPEEILEERRRERELRNVWYRRAYRWVTRQS